MDITTTELCVTFVLMVNCCEVLTVCIRLFWVGGLWVEGHGGWMGDGVGGVVRGGIAFMATEILSPLKKRLTLNRKMHYTRNEPAAFFIYFIF